MWRLVWTPESGNANPANASWRVVGSGGSGDIGIPPTPKLPCSLYQKLGFVFGQVDV